MVEPLLFEEMVWKLIESIKYLFRKLILRGNRSSFSKESGLGRIESEMWMGYARRRNVGNNAYSHCDKIQCEEGVDSIHTSFLKKKDVQ
jgi:hypothetical protein